MDRPAMPETTETHRWERYFAQLLTEAVRAGSRPDLAAPDAWQQVLRDWRAAGQEGEPFDAKPADALVSDPEAMRGLSEVPDPETYHGRRRDWLIVARVEDERSLFPEDEWITHEQLRRMAEVYDPGFRAAPVMGPAGGPAHETGEYSAHIPGRVQALAYDGYYLWALVKSRGDSMLWEVGAGAHQRSIRWWPALAELPDSPPYLRHVALLTGEPAGIPNLPALEEHFFATAGGASESEAHRIVTTEYRERTLAEGAAMTTKPDGGKDGQAPASAESLRALTKDPTFVATLAEALAGPMRAALGLPEKGAEPKEEPKRETPADPNVAGVLDTANRALQEAQDARAEAKRLNDAADKRERDRVAAEIETAIDRAVNAGRVPPNLRSALKAEAMAAEDYRTVVAGWGKLPAIYGELSRRIELRDDGTVHERTMPLAAQVPAGYGVRDSELDAARALSTWTPPAQGGTN